MTADDVDRWLAERHRRLLRDLAEILDVEAGLRAVTTTGKVLTDRELQELANEAERGYPVTCACGARVDEHGTANGGDRDHVHVWRIGGR